MRRILLMLGIEVILGASGCSQSVVTACDVAPLLFSGRKTDVYSWVKKTKPSDWVCNGTPVLSIVAGLDDDQEPAVLSMMIKAGADVNASGPNGETPLHYAAANAQSVSLQALLAAGARPNARTSQGVTPLMMVGNHAPRSAEKERLVVEALRRAGADLQAVDGQGKSARALLAERGLEVDGEVLTP